MSALIQPVFQKAAIDVALIGVNELIAGVGGQIIKVFGLILVATGGAQDVQIRSAAVNLSGVMGLGADGQLILPAPTTTWDWQNQPIQQAWFETIAGNPLNLNLSAATAIAGAIIFTQGA